MTDLVYDWLPGDVILYDNVTQAIDSAISRWSSRWFVGSYARISERAHLPSLPHERGVDEGWRVFRSAIAVRAIPASLSRLMRQALGIGAEVPDLTPSDRLLLDALSQKILENLVEELTQALLPTARSIFASEGGLSLSLTDPQGHDLLTVFLPADLLLSWLKSQLQPPVRGGTLVPLRSSLTDVSVRLKALVGRMELSLSELSELAVGDVLVLDTALDQPLEIVSASTSQAMAKGHLSQTGDGLEIVIQS